MPVAVSTPMQPPVRFTGLPAQSPPLPVQLGGPMPPERKGPSVRGSATVAPRFGSIWASPIIAGVANVVGRIQQDPILELMCIDLTGFIIPRTALEWQERGYDMGLETAIRENSGLFSIVFLSGWTSWLFTRGAQLLRNRQGEKRLGADGVPNLRWYDNHIHGETLEVLGNQFANSLHGSEGKSLQELKRHFYDGVLRRVQSTSGHIAPTMISAMEDRVGIGQANRVSMASIASGQLSDTQRAKLVDLLMASDDVRKPAMKAVQDFAVGPHSNLTTTVDVLKATDKKISDKSLPLLLKEMRTFWRQYISGVALPELGHWLTPVSASDKPHAQGLERHLLSSAFVEKASQRLFGQPTLAALNAKGQVPVSWSKRLFPSITDGVLPYVLRRRNLMIAVPYGLTIVLASAVAFLNNWLTARRHHGKVYFPGLGDVEKNGLPVKGDSRSGQVQLNHASPPTPRAAL